MSRTVNITKAFRKFLGLQTPVEKFNAGRQYALDALAIGATPDELESFASNPFDADEFDRGILEVLRKQP